MCCRWPQLVNFTRISNNYRGRCRIALGESLYASSVAAISLEASLVRYARFNWQSAFWRRVWCTTSVTQWQTFTGFHYTGCGSDLVFLATAEILLNQVTSYSALLFYLTHLCVLSRRRSWWVSGLQKIHEMNEAWLHQPQPLCLCVLHTCTLSTSTFYSYEHHFS